MTYRTTAGTMLAAALLVSACGETAPVGPGQAQVQPRETPVEAVGNRSRATSEATEQHAQRKDAKAPPASSAGSVQGKAGRHPASDPKEASSGRPHPRSKRVSRAHALARLDSRGRERLAEAGVRRVLLGLDFRGARVRASARGTVAEVVLLASQGCRAHRDEGHRILAAARDMVPYLRTVTVTVGDDAIATYQARECKPIELPPGAGQEVLTQNGSGADQTKEFTIRSDRWTVEWVNRGTFFQVWALKGDEAEEGPIVANTPGSGSRSFRGPGTFRLAVSGSGDWTVQVREG